MSYKKGDKVKVKSIDWYNINKNSEGAVIFHDLRIFDESMSKFCGKVVTIYNYNSRGNYYDIEEDGKVNYWSGEMFDGFAIDDELQEEMISLSEACSLLYSMLTTQDINDYEYVTAPAYNDVQEFVDDFCKSLNK